VDDARQTRDVRHAKSAASAHSRVAQPPHPQELVQAPAPTHANCLPASPYLLLFSYSSTVQQEICSELQYVL
jgi:hypothetical protein